MWGLAAAPLSVTASPTVARAEGDPIDLTWLAPEGCPPVERVRGWVEEQLGGPARGKPLRVEATLEAQPGGYRLSLAMRDAAGEGSRNLEAPTCEELGEAAAMIIALAHDPEAVAAARERPPPVASVAEAPEPPPLVEPPAPPASIPPPAEPPPIAAPSEPGRSFRFALAPVVGLDTSSLPSPAWLLGGRVSLVTERVSVTAHFTYLPPARATVAAASGDIDLWALGPGGCFSAWGDPRMGDGLFGALSLAGCARIEIGEMRGRGSGVPRPGDGGSLWVAPFGGAELTVAWAPWLHTSIDFEAGLPLLRPDFVIEGVGAVHRAGVVTGRAALAIGVAF